MIITTEPTDFNGDSWCVGGGGTGTPSFIATIGDGVATELEVTHGLGTKNIVVEAYMAEAPYEKLEIDWDRRGIDPENIITFIFVDPPALNSVVVIISNSNGGASGGTLYVTTIGDGILSEIPVTHNLGSRNLLVEGRMTVSPYEKIELDWDHRGGDPNNTVTFIFNSPPVAGSIVVSISTGTFALQPAASEIVPGIIELATQLEVITGVDAVKAVTPATLYNFRPQPAYLSYISGLYYDQRGVDSINTVFTTTAGVANRIELYPFAPEKTIGINQLGVALATGVGGALVKCLVYGSDSAGYPHNLFYSTAGLDVSGAAAYVKEDLGTTLWFNANTMYWLGIWHSSTAFLRSVASTGAFPVFGFGSDPQGTVLMNQIRRTVAFGTAPSSWVFTPTEFVNAQMMSIRFRAV